MEQWNILVLKKKETLLNQFQNYKARHVQKINPRKGGFILAKDSQPDNKKARIIKSNGQTPITREAQNHNPNSKKQSVKNNDV